MKKCPCSFVIKKPASAVPSVGALYSSEGGQPCKDRVAAYDDSRGFWRKTPLT